MKLKELLKGKVVILGVGNRLRGDDGFGPALIERLKGKLDADLFDCGSAPENFLGKVIKLSPDIIIVADAADFGAGAGEIKIFDIDELKNIGFSTHNLSPKVFAEFLKAQIKAKIYLLACQPKSTSFGEGLSAEVASAIEQICTHLTQIPADQTQINAD
ncbi:MAG: hydrogenase 3 maturation endopeptidase HyCI [Candidatus Omnitrophota bacterium]